MTGDARGKDAAALKNRNRWLLELAIFNNRARGVAVILHAA
jgi:hypothetical protein